MTGEQHRLRVTAWDDHKPRKQPDRKPRWARPLLMNALPKMHWATRSRIDESWQTATFDAVLKAELQHLRWDGIQFTFLPVYERQPPDTGAIAPTEKAIVDAVVKLGIVPEDNRFHNRGMMSLPPVQSNWTGVLTVIEHRQPAVGHRHEDQCSCRRSMERMQRANDDKASNKLKRRTTI